MTYQRPHHIEIANILQNFNSAFLSKAGVYFGGGTRIAMELDEYRESVDIDFMCVGGEAFKAIRSEVGSNTLGDILKPEADFSFARDVRADRDAVRVILNGKLRPIKLEFIHFENYDLTSDKGSLFPVEYIDKRSCFATILPANADRYQGDDKKDIFDLCMMRSIWGPVPPEAWAQADRIYGLSVVLYGLNKALADLEENSDHFKRLAMTGYGVENLITNQIFSDYIDLLKGDIKQIIRPS